MSSSESCSALQASDTNWPRIVRLYDALVHLAPSPVTRLNRLVAVSMADGPAAAYAELDALEDALGDYSYFHAARADLLGRLDRPGAARAAYERALELSTNPRQRAALARSAAEIGADA